jgi:hypothetical protein
MVEDEKGGCGITAASTQACSDWNALFEDDFHPLFDMKCLLQEPGGPNDEVAPVRWKDRWYASEPNSFRILRAKGEPIAEVEHLQDCLNGMIAIGPLAKDAQPKIDLGRRGKLAWKSMHEGWPPTHGSGRISPPAGGVS